MCSSPIEKVSLLQMEPLKYIVKDTYVVELMFNYLEWRFIYLKYLLRKLKTAVDSNSTPFQNGAQRGDLKLPSYRN